MGQPGLLASLLFCATIAACGGSDTSGAAGTTSSGTGGTGGQGTGGGGTGGHAKLCGDDGDPCVTEADCCYGQCTAGACDMLLCATSGVTYAISEVALPPGGVDAHNLAVDATHVFWSDDANGIWRAPKKGGQGVLLPGTKKALYFVLDGDDVYFTAGGQAPSVGSLQRAPKKGGASTTVVNGITGEFLAVDEHDVYWTSGGALYKTDKTNPATPILLSEQPQQPAFLDLVHDQTSLFWLHLDEVEPVIGSIYGLPKAGGSPEALLAGSHARGLVQAGDHLYWRSSTTDPGIRRIPKVGGAPSLVVSDLASALAVDDTSVYWIDQEVEGSGIHRTPREGGASVTLVDGARSSTLVVDETCVYWIDSEKARLVKVFKGAP